MSEDRALDEFLGEDDTADSEESEAGDDGDTSDESDTEPDGPTGAVSTTAFTPEGADCESCGASVRRRWRDDDALVCADCKAW